MYVPRHSENVYLHINLNPNYYKYMDYSICVNIIHTCTADSLIIALPKAVLFPA